MQAVHGHAWEKGEEGSQRGQRPGRQDDGASLGYDLMEDGSWSCVNSVAHTLHRRSSH